MCKSFFHVSCAHAAGFLSEPIYTVDHAQVGEPQSDAYLAHCKLHSDKTVIKKRRRAFLTHLLTSRKRREDIIQRRKGKDSFNIFETELFHKRNSTESEYV